MPPVLHVALDELSAGGHEQVRAVEIGAAEGQRHHVLQLIAEAEGAAGLIEAGARPQPGADVLVQQPAIHDQVERIVRRVHLDGAERAVPERLHLDPRVLDAIRVAAAADQRMDLVD